MIGGTASLARNQVAAAALEFALAAPILLIMLFGSLEVGLNLYLKSVLEGAMTQAGRSSSLQLAQAGQSTIDDLVRSQVHAVLPDATVTFARRNYVNFSDRGRPEDFTDSNHNGAYDTGECFTDENDNGVWDADVGKQGLGGANDVVLYTATLDYTDVLPDFSTLGMTGVRRIVASTTLRNQPFSVQTARVTRTVCA
ncbi:MAG: hypothetical protein RLZZ08_428 [Pseudomonadota bacterium]|jgi:Flp pilus assembly protein TadG